MFAFLIVAIFIFSSPSTARHHHHHQKTRPTVFSWEQASSIPKINSTYHAAHPFCSFEYEAIIAYTAILFCEANQMDVRCDGNKDIMLKVAMEENVTESEIYQICYHSKVAKPEFAEHCKHNDFITVANLVCDLEHQQKEADALIKFAMETDAILPISLQRIKDEKGMTDESKWRVMRAYIMDNHPRYLWGAFITREKLRNNQ